MKVLISTGQKIEGQVFLALFIISEEPSNTSLIRLLLYQVKICILSEIDIQMKLLESFKVKLMQGSKGGI